MEILIVVGGIAFFVWLCTKAEDRRIVQRGEELAAPEWARALFVIVMTALALLVLVGLAGLGLAS